MTTSATLRARLMRKFVFNQPEARRSATASHRQIVAPTQVAFGKSPYSQTRYRFTT